MNYAWNTGSTIYANDIRMNGSVQQIRETKFSSITDGLSKTILMSEILIGDNNDAVFTFPRDLPYSVGAGREDARGLCSRSAVSSWALIC